MQARIVATVKPLRKHRPPDTATGCICAYGSLAFPNASTHPPGMCGREREGQRMAAASAARLSGSRAGRLADGRTRRRGLCFGWPYRIFPRVPPQHPPPSTQGSPPNVPFWAGQRRRPRPLRSQIERRAQQTPTSLQQVQARRRCHTDKPTNPGPSTHSRRARLRRRLCRYLSFLFSLAPFPTPHATA